MGSVQGDWWCVTNLGNGWMVGHFTLFCNAKLHKNRSKVEMKKEKNENQIRNEYIGSNECAMR